MNNPLNQPRGFTGAPSIHHAPAYVPARVVEIPALSYPADATLSVRLPNRVTLSKAIRRCLGLGPSAPIELVPPPRRGMNWHLDTRSTATRRLPATPTATGEFFCGHLLRKEHFLRMGVEERDPESGRIAKGETRIGSRLTLRLLREVAPGYFALEKA